MSDVITDRLSEGANAAGERLVSNLSPRGRAWMERVVERLSQEADAGVEAAHKVLRGEECPPCVKRKATLAEFNRQRVQQFRDWLNRGPSQEGG